jgi:hypothetical protein
MSVLDLALNVSTLHNHKIPELSGRFAELGKFAEDLDKVQVYPSLASFYNIRVQLFLEKPT